SRIALPERYDGNRSLFRGFVNQCRLLFFTNADQYPTDVSKVGLVMSLLSGNALRWASPYIEKDSPLLYSFELFLKEFSKVFDDPQRTQTANDSIRALRQDPNSVSIYASEFRRLMMDLDWNESAFFSQFSEGLNENVLDTLALFQTPTDLKGFINSAITVDARLTRRKEEKARKRRGIQPQTTSGPQLPEPMHVDAIHRTVSQPERERRMKLGLCFYCGGEKHQAQNCTVRKPPLNLRQASNDPSSTELCPRPNSDHSNRFMVPVTVHVPGKHSFKIMAMIDSGASGVFINKSLVDSQTIPTQSKEEPVAVEFIDGSPLTGGPITHHTKPLNIQIQGNHLESATFDVMNCFHADMNHKFLSNFCIKNCIQYHTKLTQTMKAKATTSMPQGSMSISGPSPGLPLINSKADHRSIKAQDIPKETNNHSNSQVHVSQESRIPAHHNHSQSQSQSHSHSHSQSIMKKPNHSHGHNTMKKPSHSHSQGIQVNQPPSQSHSQGIQVNQPPSQSHRQNTNASHKTSKTDKESKVNTAIQVDSTPDIPLEDHSHSDQSIKSELDSQSDSYSEDLTYEFESFDDSESISSFDQCPDSDDDMELSTTPDNMSVISEIPSSTPIVEEISDMEDQIFMTPRPMTPPPADPVEPIRKRHSENLLDEQVALKKKKPRVSHMIGLISQAKPPSPRQEEPDEPKKGIDDPDPRPIWQPKIIVGAIDSSQASDLTAMIKAKSKTDPEAITLITKSQKPGSKITVTEGLVRYNNLLF
ncbi:Retrotransposon-derived protein PEG10, partial [Zancudomyces culisetae]